MDGLVKVLSGTLSPNANTRIAAEMALQRSLENDETALLLAQLSMDQSAALHLRQMSRFPVAASVGLQDDHAAGLSLRRYTKTHWTPAASETYKAKLPCQAAVKVQVKATVLSGLSAPQRQIRILAAAIVSEIAHWDWPDEWEDLLSILMQLLSTGRADAVHGALAVLIDVVKSDLTEDQLIPLARDMLPLLLTILADAQTYSAASRARTVAVFRECVQALFMVKEQFPAAVSEASKSILPSWNAALHAILLADLQQDLRDETSWQNFALRIECFKAVDAVLSTFPKSLLSTMDSLLQISVQHMCTLAPVYRSLYLVDSDDTEPTFADEGADVSCSLVTLLGHAFDLLQHGTRKAWLRSSFLDKETARASSLLTACVAAVFSYARVTTENEETWQDANAFVAEEDQDGLSFTVRDASLDLLSALAEAYGRSILGPLDTSLKEALASAQTQSENEWKEMEAALSAIGSISQEVVGWLEDDAEAQRSPSIDLQALFQQAAFPGLSRSDQPYLQGRAFVFCSQFVTALDTKTVEQFVQQALAVLHGAHVAAAVKLSAVRALSNCFRHPSNANLMQQYSAASLSAVIPLLAHTSESTLVLLLETLEYAVRPNAPDVTDDLYSKVAQSVLQVWTRSANEPSVSMAVANLFGGLTALDSPAAHQVVFHSVIPSLSTALIVTEAEQEHLPAAALEIIDNILTNAKTPLDEKAYAHVGPPLLTLLERTESRSITQEGLEVLASFVKKGCHQILASPQHGIQHVFAVIARVLRPEAAEAGGLFVGDLIVHLLREAGESVMPVLPELLRTLILRLDGASTAGFSQSLIIPFALLIHTQQEAVLSLLEQFGVLEGCREPALSILCSRWGDNVETFQGFWAQRVSTLALVKLFVARHPLLERLFVRGDVIVVPSQGILTRSRAKQNPDQYQQVPFPAKILKLLCAELTSEGLGAAMVAINAGSDDGNDDWEEEEDDQADALADLGLRPSDLLDDLDGRPDDDDFADDEISKVDLSAVVAECLQQAYRDDAQRLLHLSQYLGEQERRVLEIAIRSH